MHALPAAPVTKPGIQCSATFFSGANLTGLALKLAFPRHVQSYERGCVYLDDFSSTKPSFAYKAVSYRLQCRCVRLCACVRLASTERATARVTPRGSAARKIEAVRGGWLCAR